MVMFIRFLAGYRHNFKGPYVLRVFSIIYPILVISIIAISPIFINNRHVNIYIYPVYFDLIIIFLHAFQTQDKYIYEFYKFINGLDNLFGAKKLYNRLDYFLKFCAFIYPLNKMFVSLFVCIHMPDFCFKHFKVELTIDFIFCSLSSFGKVNMIILIGLLYCRTKLLRNNLESEFTGQFCNRYCVTKYIRLYEMLMDSFKIIGRPLKITVRSIPKLTLIRNPKL